MGDQIVFQQQDEVNCFNLVNEMVEESDHNEFNLAVTEFSLQEALPNTSLLAGFFNTNFSKEIAKLFS